MEQKQEGDLGDSRLRMDRLKVCTQLIIFIALKGFGETHTRKSIGLNTEKNYS